MKTNVKKMLWETEEGCYVYIDSNVLLDDLKFNKGNQYLMEISGIGIVRMVPYSINKEKGHLVYDCLTNKDLYNVSLDRILSIKEIISYPLQHSPAKHFDEIENKYSEELIYNIDNLLSVIEDNAVDISENEYLDEPLCEEAIYRKASQMASMLRIAKKEIDHFSNIVIDVNKLRKAIYPGENIASRYSNKYCPA
ncbi:hypothetical protein NG800_011505 [Epilithonimonas ginsengisoli]|uniref:PIN domain-containing protein n=1 Tax=Epilithonimonas ginsengisoli TaxID=1245592 RepID=A0ABU4JIM7_9FLAO|nr:MULTISPECIES: hypothetical protein [Chryseobacterium group]MBV6879105.1 hypothetical protein [Epilithonimonas sp. FP105]MDW8549539.1 hypothetical protein [Epilithonimonas ginsengisoli]OAH74401.1 hypothetical protein AXA65_06485 [Chryseobacterium sp. FP211-J200]